MVSDGFLNPEILCQQRKKKKNDQKQRRRGGKSAGGKSVSGKSVAGEGGDAKEGGVVEATVEEEETLKPKIPNQVPFETFSKFVEPFVRPINEDDLSLLELTGVSMP